MTSTRALQRCMRGENRRDLGNLGTPCWSGVGARDAAQMFRAPWLQTRLQSRSGRADRHARRLACPPRSVSQRARKQGDGSPSRVRSNRCASHLSVCTARGRAITGKGRRQRRQRRKARGVRAASKASKKAGPASSILAGTGKGDPKVGSWSSAKRRVLPEAMGPQPGWPKSRNTDPPSPLPSLWPGLLLSPLRAGAPRTWGDATNLCARSWPNLATAAWRELRDECPLSLRRRPCREGQTKGGTTMRGQQKR